MNDLNNATPCNIIRALIYRKYHRRIHHACIILHTYRYLNHLNKPPKHIVHVQTNHQMFLSKPLSMFKTQNVVM